jgi:hypothetical protein
MSVSKDELPSKSVILTTQHQQPQPTKRVAISKALRDAVFSKYCPDYNNAYCYVGCGEKITPFNFECGHVTSCFEGGPTILENLRPICGRCNRSMGAKNLNDFIKECGFHSIERNPDVSMNDPSNYVASQILHTQTQIQLQLQQVQLSQMQEQIQRIQIQQAPQVSVVDGIDSSSKETKPKIITASKKETKHKINGYNLFVKEQMSILKKTSTPNPNITSPISSDLDVGTNRMELVVHMWNQLSETEKQDWKEKANMMNLCEMDESSLISACLQSEFSCGCDGSDVIETSRDNYVGSPITPT